jgi:hypothetical protein
MFNYSNNSFTNLDELIPNAVRFWIYLIFLIPSIICSLFVLYHLLSSRTLRLALHNHAIIIFLFIGLIYQVTIYPWMLYFYQHEGIWKRSLFFCTLWIFIDWGLYFTQTILFAWATMERHILIFHSKWVSTRRKRFFIHFLPLLLLLIYCLIYYTVITFLPPCENIFDDYYTICVELCLFKTSALRIYDTIAHQILPNLIIVVFSIALLLRVRWQKQCTGQSLQWRKHWKMTVQLLFVSIIYLIFALPLTLMNLLHLCGLSRDVTANFMEYVLFFNYCMMLLCPFACALSLPHIRDKISNILRLGRPVRTVVPTTWAIRDSNFNQRFVQ